jgi:polysaccharide export outer membrane protein
MKGFRMFHRFLSTFLATAVLVAPLAQAQTQPIQPAAAASRPAAAGPTGAAPATRPPVGAQTPPLRPAAAPASSPVAGAEPKLGIGDTVRVTVYQNPDLTVESRVSEAGQINMPLIGAVTIGGLTVPASQTLIERLLRDGGFVIRPQVTVQTLAIRSSQVSVLGQVAKPGRYPIEQVGIKVSEMVAIAGGVVPGGADVVTLVGTRNGQPFKRDIDLPQILQAGKADLDEVLANGDVIHVDRAPIYYIYGEIQRPGQFRLERGMTLMQAMAQAGGISARGTERGIRINRRNEAGELKVVQPKMDDLVQRDDVIYVRESLF